MKDIELLDPPYDNLNVSVPPGPPTLDDWLMARPELWCVGREVQLETFEQATSGPAE